MKPWLNTLVRNLFGADKPTAPITKNRARPMLETLEDRLVPTAVIYTVNDISDVAHGSATGPLVSLRDAVTAANAHNAGDTIQFSSAIAGKTIKLNCMLRVCGSEKIDGTGRNMTISGQGKTEIFEFNGGKGANTFTLKGLTLTGGNYAVDGDEEVKEEDGGGAIGTVNCDGSDSLVIQSCNFNHNTTDGTGGAISDYGAKLTIQDCLITGNTSGNEGGGVLFHGYDDASFLMERTTISNNHVTNHEQGGGVTIENATTNTINSCVFTGNVTGGEGGALALRDAGTATIQNSTFSANKANDGGGLWNSSTTLTLKTSTISGNTAANNGGGILNYGNLNAINTTISGNTANNGGGVENKYSTATFTNCTIAVNKAKTFGGGIETTNGTTNLKNTIVSDNRVGAALNDLHRTSGTINAQYSLIEAPAGAINGTNSHNILFVSADLGPLQYNGGPAGLLTMLPSHTSKALRAGSVALIAPGTTTDERGVARTYANTVDIGALEATIDYRRSF